MRQFLAAGSIVLSIGAAVAGESLAPPQRALTFEQRVNAQEAIERVYYSHQTGATKLFEQAVPRAVIEAHVRKTLDESLALQAYWKTTVTDAMLQRELERMAAGTRMPDRLSELFAALGNDPFLVKECLARATLVDRLVRNFYDNDPALHAEARMGAEEVRRRLIVGELRAEDEHPGRTVMRFVLGEEDDTDPQVLRLKPEELHARRAELPERIGQPGPIEEHADGFSFPVVIGESATGLRVATYVSSKRTWDDWWAGAGSRVGGELVRAVASEGGTLPQPATTLRAPSGGNCEGDDTWVRWDESGTPSPRRSHTAVWTGSVVVIWGGLGDRGILLTGGRYDPATDAWQPTATTGAPSARLFHRAVWTGSSMIVWGGRVATGAPYFTDGGRYDPISDTWLPTSLVGAPPGRQGFTAIWTGDRMIVWGGASSVGFQGGARYDPAGDTWSPVATSNAPSPRSGHTAVWTGSRMIVWGGSPDTAGPTGGRYDPASDTWTPTSTTNAPSPRNGHTAIWTGTRMVIWGGAWGAVHLQSGARYDPVSDTWAATSMTGAPSVRMGHGAVWTGATMVVWGGSVTNFDTGAATYPADGGRYDPVSDLWQPTASAGAPESRANGTMIWTGAVVIVWGGSRIEGFELVTRYFETGGRYDPATDTWTPTALTGAPRARYAHTAIWTGSAMIVWGGTTANGTYFNDGGRYDPATDAWTRTTTVGAPEPRVGHRALWTGTAMLVWGGSSFTQPLNTGGAYDPIADTWATMASAGAPQGRTYYAAVWTGKEMLVWGGWRSDGYVATGGRYDPASNSWSSMTTKDAPAPRQSPAAAWTGAAFVVWGGSNSQAGLPSGGRYDPVRDTWRPTALAGAPEGRRSPGGVWTGRTLVIWGGTVRAADGTWIQTATGGRYDPAADAWQTTSTENAPEPRVAHAAAWTGREMLVWAGYGTTLLGNGGRYDPVSDIWKGMSAQNTPSARSDPSAVWDGREMLVWGGYDSTVPFLLTNTGGSYRATPGEVCNGLDDDCDGVVDDGGDALCNDDNPCTDDSCQREAGCVFTPNAGTCDDGNACTATDRCEGGACNGTPLTGTPCEDGNACTVNDTCAAGACVTGPPRDCEDGNLCTVESCNPASGCVPAGPRMCNDANTCTDDSCDPAVGCVYTPDDAHWCDDNDPCTQDDHCHDGRCVAALKPCDDHNPCTDDTCEPWGCNHANTTRPCDDGNACTGGDTCQFGSCVGQALDGTPCDDHNACSSGDVCVQGYCQYATYQTCDDGNPCTDDWCNPQSGACAFYAREGGCEDGDLCTQGDTCQAGTCVGGQPLDCFACPSDMQRDGQLCRRTYDVPVWYYMFNQENSCDGWGSSLYNDCAGGDYGFIFSDFTYNLVPVRVDIQFNSGISCNSGVSTVALNGVTIGTFAPLPYCTCYPSPRLVSFPAVDVAAYRPFGDNTVAITPGPGCEGLSDGPGLDGNFMRVTVEYAIHDERCQDAVCDSASGACNYADRADGTACTGACHTAGVCGGGACNAPEVSCDDGNPCTDDRCDPDTGCIHEPTSCDDGNVCTNDDCDPASGCTSVPNANSCDDGDRCTVGDHCELGACIGSPCDDGDLCTVDSCDPQLGCVFQDITPFCDDGNVCTTDACDPYMGCVHLPNSASCSDTDPCTVDEHCEGGSCVATGVSIPWDVTNVVASKAGASATFQWDGVEGATSYGVLRGAIRSLPVGGFPANETCLASALVAATIGDATVPSPGSGFWYLVRGANACATGSYGWQEIDGVPTFERYSSTCP